MMAGSSSSFPQGSSFHNIYQGMDIDNLFSPNGASAAAAASTAESSSHALLYSLSVLKEKVRQLESLVSILILPNRTGRQESMAMAATGLGNMIQEVIFAASTLGCTIQQLVPNHIDPLPPPAPDIMNAKVETASRSIDYGAFNNNNFFSSGSAEINFSGNVIDVENDGGAAAKDRRAGKSKETTRGSDASASNGLEVIELDAADLLAKYTHYCQVCGKGFRRDANLRMHMRAHGDEYKSAAALANPMKRSSGGGGWDAVQKESRSTLKYSCPHEGCRWNRKHAKFQPLKSVVCVKNHYKRSHCPKMYVCKRCNLKQFSVLSDLRTHEKHCGDMRWRCSCGTNFSRKDKLMGHVALFVGHTPQLNG